MSTTEPEFTDRIYHSKRDKWIVILLWIIILVCAGSAISITFLEISFLLLISQEILLLGVVAFCLSILRSTYYVLRKESLLVRSGPFKWSIQYSEINEIVPERNLWSGAALSLDRLHVYHHGSKVGTYISPDRDSAFLIDLAERCSDLTYMENRIIRVNKVNSK